MYVERFGCRSRRYRLTRRRPLSRTLFSGVTSSAFAISWPASLLVTRFNRSWTPKRKLARGYMQPCLLEKCATQVSVFLFMAVLVVCNSALAADPQSDAHIDGQLAAVLRNQQFTGRIEQMLEKRLGRKINPNLARIGQLLWFDTSGGLHDDNTCGGCHAPATGFGDARSIAVGIQSNLIVGHKREGPHNQRRTPKALNIAFFPALMWNGRFNSLSGDPFDNSTGFKFPPPEGTTRFPPNDPIIRHLAQAQGEMPPTELTEVAGYTGTKGTPYSLGPLFDQFDDGKGSNLPIPDSEGFRNDPIRAAVLD